MPKCELKINEKVEFFEKFILNQNTVRNWIYTLQL